jgi:hypothetical protein
MPDRLALGPTSICPAIASLAKPGTVSFDHARQNPAAPPLAKPAAQAAPYAALFFSMTR